MAIRNRARRRAMTLVELLVVVMIITILATIVLGAMFNAAEAARAARTRAQIAKINDLLAPLWEGYRTRRVPIVIADPNNRVQAAQLRLDALRELMRMELPDRKSDVADDPVAVARPALSIAFKQRATTMAGSMGAWTVDQQGAECLYMILALLQDGDSNGLEFFKQTEIGDVDNDKMPEILDGWGTPIRLLRWAPGFTSDVSNSTLQKPAGSTAEPDYFDPLGARGTPTSSPATFYLYPLVMSAGADKQWDIVFDGATAIRYSQTTPGKNDPYSAHGLSKKIGAPDDNGGSVINEHLDNIHNHLIATGTN